MTANAFAEDVKKAKEAGMNGHIAKPIDLNIVLKVLGEVIVILARRTGESLITRSPLCW